MMPPKHSKDSFYHEIFANRSLQFEKIKFVGFDMDYTLAVYNSPDYEELLFNLIRDVLVEKGYPEEFKKFHYQSVFAMRGFWFDNMYGIFLKTDQYGNILLAVKGFYILKTQEILTLYPNKYMKFDESRIYVMNTLYHLPEMSLLISIIHWFLSNEDYNKTKCGFYKDNFFMSYESMFQDLRESTNYVHLKGTLKNETINNLDKYVRKDIRLPNMLDKIRESGTKTFLLTNSDYTYTQHIMTHMFSIPEVKDWTTYFDYIVVDAQKPKFFFNGSVFKSIDKETGRPIVGQHLGPFHSGQIYAGGSCEEFSKLIASRGKDVLYVGDHIYGDILKSKKQVGWRTYLIVPELTYELLVWKMEQHHYKEILRLDRKLENIYASVDMYSNSQPDVRSIKTEIKENAKEMDDAYGTLGSLFRNGSRLTFFSSQIQRYADLYSSSAINLIYYPLNYMFRSKPMLLPHETIGLNDNLNIEEISDKDIMLFRKRLVGKIFKSNSPIDSEIDKTSQSRTLV